MRSALLICVVLIGCSDEEEVAPLDVPAGCNPIAFEHDCMLPYPSDYFLSSDGVSLSESAQTFFEPGVSIDGFAVHPARGFSPGNQILALFPQAIDPAPLVGPHDDVSASLDADSPTVILDVERGERVLHLAELDPRATEDERRSLVIRPLVRLRDDARYVVAIRGLTDPDGVGVPVPEGFRRLRDGVADPALADLGARYDADVFGPLEAAGVARAELQLAWDFTTRSFEDAAGDMLRVRDRVMAQFESEAPSIRVDAVADQPEEHTFRRIEATVTVPLFLESPEPLAPLHRDSSGRVTENGSVDVPFTIWVPESVANRPPGAPPARLLQFGHGFFGERHEVDSFIDSLADERQLVVVAADWWGMAEEDRAKVAELIVSDPNHTMRFTDRLHQAIANFIAVAYAATGPLLDLPELQIGEAPLFDRAVLYYYGISMGGILGGTYLALSPHIERGVLSVGGADFSFMMFRARPFLAFLAVLGTVTTDPVDQQKFALLSQTSFDRVDPLTYAPHVMSDTLDGGPGTRQILMQIGIGDDQVPNFASHLHARALGLSLLAPIARELPALSAEEGPIASALVEFDFGIDPLPGVDAIPPTVETEAHEGVRRLEAAKEQLHRFFQVDGLVEPTCDGPCDPE